MKQRSNFWDNFKGILIFLVVFGHFIYAYATKIPDSLAAHIYTFIYAFHMPAFIFCSGYFSKSERSRSITSLITLSLYYILFNTLMLFFAHYYIGSSIKLLTPYYSYWYILSLITWRALIGKLGNVKGILLLSVIISLALGFSKEFTNLLSLRRTVAFFPFFVAGYLLNKQTVEDFLNRRKTWHMVLSGIGVLLVAAVAFWAVDHFALTASATLMNAYSKKSTIFHRILLFTISAAAIAGMFLVVPNRKIPFLSKIGKNSLLIYLAHRFFTIIYYREIFPAKTYSDSYLLYALIATVVTCIIFSSERLNQWLSKECSNAATALTSRDNKAGLRIVAVVACVFLCLLLLIAADK